MSGTAFLEEVISWDHEKRREKVEEALPQLIKYLQNHQSHEEAIGILQIVCQAFVPLVSQEDLERKVFSLISQQVKELLDSVLEEIHNTLQQNQEPACDHLIALLQHVLDVLECVEECVKHVVSLLNSIQVSQIRSLLHCAIHALKGSYRHCQESGQLYGDGLPHFSDSLSAIFRRAHSLQMAFLNLLEKISVGGSAWEADIQDITKVCEGLFSLCRLVACLELRLTVSLWKALSKLVLQNQETVCVQLDLCSIISYLCEEICSGVTQLIELAPPLSVQDEMMLSQGDDKAFSRSLKIINFQLKVLVAIVKDCHGYLSGSASDIYKLMVHLKSVTPPSLSAPKLQTKHEEMVQQQLCYVLHPLTSHLLTCPAFREFVLKDEDLNEERCLPRLLLQVLVMNILCQAAVDIFAVWMEKASETSYTSPTSCNILASVFASLEKCHVEVCLPVYITSTAHNGKPSRMVSLYQYTVEHICAFIGSCPAKLFNIVEEQLLCALLSLNPISTQAAADAWCFMARYGTAALCLHQTRHLLSLCRDIKSQAPFSCSITCLTSLLGRLIKFLAPELQTELLAEFSAADNIALWSDISLDGLSEGVERSVAQSLVTSCLKSVRTFSQCSAPTVGDTASVIPSLRCLHNVMSNTAMTQCLGPHQGAAILDSVSSLWRAWVADQPLPSINTPAPNTGQSVCHLYLAALVTLTSDVVDQLDSKILLQVLLVAHKAVSRSSLGELTLAVVSFLGAMGPVRLPPSFEQGQILRKIADTFAAVLSYDSGIVQHSALAAFTRFAEQTAYEAVVPECLAQKQGLQEKVTAFLQKVPYDDKDQNFDAVSYLRQQRDRFRMKMLAANDAKDVSEFTSSSETSGPHKRQRMTDNLGHEEQNGYQTAVEELECLVKRMEKLKMDGPMPNWVTVRVRPLLQRLSACLDHQNR